MSASIKKRFLELLDKDEEFRLAVAAKLGLLDRLNSLQRSVDGLVVEVKALREGQEKLWQNVEKLWEEVRSLREGQDYIVREQARMSRAVSDIATTLERLTLSLEDEASEVVAFDLRGKLGVDLKFSRVFVDSKEVDLYASQGDLWVIVEASTRFGVKLVEEVTRKADLIRRLRPELVRPRLIKTIYTLVPLNDAVEEARRQGVWVLTWKEELTPLVIHTTDASNPPT